MPSRNVQCENCEHQFEVEVTCVHNGGFPTTHLNYEPEQCPECEDDLSDEQISAISQGIYEDALAMRADYDYERAKDRSLGL